MKISKESFGDLVVGFWIGMFVMSCFWRIYGS